MMYKHLEDGTHQLTITGPELADILELVVSLTKLGGDPLRIGNELFNALGFRDVYNEYELTPDEEACFEKVYKRLGDGTFQIVFSDSKYLKIANLILLLDENDDANGICGELFNTLGYQEAVKEFMNSPEGPDILMRTSSEVGHA